MTVYVLTIGWDYEGEALLGVYSSREKAEQAREDEGYGKLMVYPVEVDAEPYIR